LPSFTDAAFSNISFVENGHVTSAIPSRPNTYALTVVQSGRCLVVPSRLPRNGASFSVSTPAQPLVALHEHFDPVTSPSTESPWRTRSTCN
jgi:Tfp pilus tip-associated adhesin PilY1